MTRFAPPTAFTPLQNELATVADLRRKVDDLSKQAQAMANALLIASLELDVLVHRLSEANEAWASHDCAEALPSSAEIGAAGNGAPLPSSAGYGASGNGRQPGR